jgi:hypothetical protein
MANAIIENVEPTETGVATGMNTIMRTVGGAVGGQLSAAVLTAHLGVGGNPTDAGYTAAFTVIAISLLGSVVFVLAVPGRRHARKAAATSPGAEEVPAGLLVEPAVPIAIDEPLSGQTLAGRVRRGRERVPAAVLTVIGDHGREVLHTRADDAGEFRIHVPSGHYYVIVTDAGRDPKAVAVELNGHPVSLDVALPAPDVTEPLPVAPNFPPAEYLTPRA